MGSKPAKEPWVERQLKKVWGWCLFIWGAISVLFKKK